ncbi:MAG: hypothetical protein KDC98_05155 [Planctomycetes bacterium]|nr:hypothetical protein [Planctomycetota bacterium]
MIDRESVSASGTMTSASQRVENSRIAATTEHPADFDGWQLRATRTARRLLLGFTNFLTLTNEDKR